MASLRKYCLGATKSFASSGVFPLTVTVHPTRMSNCHFSSEIWHLNLACARSFWGALVPAAFVFLLSVVAIPLPTWLSNLIRPIKEPFTSFLTLQEAEALDAAAKAALGEGGQGEADSAAEHVESRHFWKSLLLSWFALIETLVWLGITSFTIIKNERDPVYVASPFVLALTWLFAAVRPIVRPKTTPPYDLFTLYLIYAVFEMVSLGSFAYNYRAYGTPFPPSLILTAHILNLCALLILVAIVLSMPLSVPSSRVEKAKIVSLPWVALPYSLTYRNGPGIVRFSGRLYDALGLDHIFVGVALSKARTCSPSVCLITRGLKVFIRVPMLR
jgi:hypothetical protein